MSEQYDKLKELINQSEAFYKNEQYEKAIEYLLKALELNLTQEEKAEIWSMIGDIYLYNLEMEEVIQVYLKCIELVPDSLIYLYRLGIAYKENKQYEKAIKIFLNLIERKPNHEPYWFELAFSYAGECTKALLRCAELKPDDEFNLSKLGKSYEFNSQYKEAIQTYLKCIELVGTPLSFLYYEDLGKAYGDNEQGEKAIESFLEAIKLNPDEPHMYILLGDACVKNGQYKDAIKVFEKVIELLKKS